MASQTVLLSLAVLACLAAIALAAPQRYDDNGSAVMFRERRAAPRYGGGSRRGAATRQAPVSVAPVQSKEAEEEAVQDSEEELEQAITPKPLRQSRGRPAAPKPTPAQESDEDEDEDEDEVDQEEGGAPPSFDGKQRGGATAIATTYSRGKGASGNSHATAYGGRFSGGSFEKRHH